MGLWHVDGHREHVAAVVLYYYHVDPQLVGGDMEFCGREPLDFLGFGDGERNYRDFHRDSMRAALREGPESKVAHCRVPIREGTLLVFSNCQLVHRVLKMVNRGSSEASRDFVALFVLDPAFGPLKPARRVLSAGYDIVRVLQHCGVSMRQCPQAVALVLEFLRLRPSEVERKRTRTEMLREQLQPSGEFCGRSKVYHLGNACFTMVGWLHNLLTYTDKGDLGIFQDARWKGETVLEALNRTPQQLGRGMSETLSLATQELENRLEEERAVRAGEWGERKKRDQRDQRDPDEARRRELTSLQVPVPHRLHGRLLELQAACPASVGLQIPNPKGEVCVGSEGATALKEIGVSNGEKNVAAHLPAQHKVNLEEEWIECRSLKKGGFASGFIKARHVTGPLAVGGYATLLDANGDGSVALLKKAIKAERGNKMGVLEDGTQVEVTGHWFECSWGGQGPPNHGFIPAQSIPLDEVCLRGPRKDVLELRDMLLKTETGPTAEGRKGATKKQRPKAKGSCQKKNNSSHT